jgi:chromosome segregation ATPase
MADTDDTTHKFSDEPNWLTAILQNLFAEVAQLRESVEARNRETRPLAETLEAMRVDIQQLKDGQESLRNGQESLRKEVREGFARMERKQDLLNNRLLSAEGDIVGLDRRVEALESRET